MNDYIYDEMNQDEKKHWWFAARRKIILRIVDNYAMNKEHPIKILDAGCGCGYFLHCLEKYGAVTGIDNNEKAIVYSKKTVNGEILKGDLTNSSLLQHESFDIIFALDVLEHIEDDSLTLMNLKMSLRKGGMMLITVPAHMELWSYHDENHMHYRRYEKAALTKLLKNNKLHIEYLSYYNAWLYYPIKIVRKIRKSLMRANKISVFKDEKKPSYIINKVLYLIFVSESFFIRHKINLPFGVSLLAIIRKE